VKVLLRLILAVAWSAAATLPSLGGTASAGEPPPFPAPSTERWATWYQWRQPREDRSVIWFPQGDLFTPPQADQKQPRFHTTWQRYHTDSRVFDVASVGFGENFGIVRRPGSAEGNGWQLGVSGAVFAIFNLDSASFDLLNADYVVGFPFSVRRGDFSARARLFHQSSHLGDEFLLNPNSYPPVERINLSFETLELLASWEHRGFRAYGGGSRILHSETPLGRDRLQGGMDFRGAPLSWKTARLVAGLDIEAWDETDWNADVSFKTGLMLRSPYGDARSIQFLLEYYSGRAPHGQFYTLDVHYFGAGIAYGF